MEVSYGIDTFDRLDSSFDRRVAVMELQPQLGLLAQRRFGHNPRDSADPAAAWLCLGC